MTGRIRILTPEDRRVSDRTMAAGFASAFLNYEVAKGAPRAGLPALHRNKPDRLACRLIPAINRLIPAVMPPIATDA